MVIDETTVQATQVMSDQNMVGLLNTGSATAMLAFIELPLGPSVPVAPR